MVQMVEILKTLDIRMVKWASGRCVKSDIVQISYCEHLTEVVQVVIKA